MLEGIIGSLVWLAANGLYIDMKRKGQTGLSRVILFWMGTPATWIWFFLVPEGSRVQVRDAGDDPGALLAEIRRAKRLEAGSAGSPAEEEGQGRA